MKKLYVVDHFVPFPTSEYGGMWNVIAEDDDECFDLISESDEGFNQPFYGKLRENINKSQVFLLGEDVESKVVDAFLT
jgi:hypothetical protein